MTEEQKYVFEEEDQQNKDKGAVQGFLEFLWNSKNKEFCGRDGASWAKVSLFYGIFYLTLAGFFIFMVYILHVLTPKDKPTYYGISSVMNQRGINPGLGFRPHTDPEDYIIKYNPLVNLEEEYGLRKYSDNLRHFLADKYTYKQSDNELLADCTDGVTTESLLSTGKACRFDHEKIFHEANCSAENNAFGYQTSKPCVLIKLNKIVSWKPVTKEDHIKIKCAGENSFDIDNVKKVTYHSEDSINNNEEGRISTKYFPFFGQKAYHAPFIWVQFDVEPNVLVNIECKAYADNIDNSDRLNRRGQTKFSLYIQQKKPRDDL